MTEREWARAIGAKAATKQGGYATGFTTADRDKYDRAIRRILAHAAQATRGTEAS